MYIATGSLWDEGMKDAPDHGIEGRTQLFARAGAFTITGRGTVLAGLAPRSATVKLGDLLDVRLGGRTIARTPVRGVESWMGSPPPPEGWQRLGILIDAEALGGERDNLEVWVLQTPDERE
jgi:hypothetical protein